MNKIVTWVVIVVVVLMGGYVFFGSSEDDNASGQVAVTSGNVKEFKVEAFQFEFSPSTIEVNQGDVVRIIASSRDVPHGLAIPEFGVNMYLDGLKEQTVEFVADKKGTFPFSCSVSCGIGHGSMRGQLIVN